MNWVNHFLYKLLKQPKQTSSLLWIMENKDVDRISNLPDTVLNHILSLLPMKTAVRTSVLSRRWRYLWAYIPNIDFNFMELTTLTRKEMVSVVNRFLQLRKEIQIQRFHLCFYPSKKFSFPVTKWIHFITVRGVQELDLDFTWRCSDLGLLGSFTWRKRFKLPCFVFNCPTITVLKLDFCVLSLPSDFNGLRSLKILSLSYVEVSDESIWRLILNCPVLESLSIVYCHLLKYLKVSGPGLMLKRLTVMSLWNLQAIEIDAPSLLSLQYDGKMIDLSFKNISQLVDAMINFEDCQEAEWRGDHKKTLSELSHVAILTVCGQFLQVIYEDRNNLSPFAMFPNLTELHLLKSPMLESMLITVASILIGCPYLERVFIDVRLITEFKLDDHGSLNVYCWRVYGQWRFEHFNCVFHHLKMVKMKSFMARRNEICLLKFFMEKAIGLESVILTGPEDRHLGFRGEDCLWHLELIEKTLRSLCCEFLSLQGTSMPVIIFHDDYDS